MESISTYSLRLPLLPRDHIKNSVAARGTLSPATVSDASPSQPRTRHSPRISHGRFQTPSSDFSPFVGNSVMSSLPPMIRVQGAQAKKRKTGGSTSTPAPEHKAIPAPAHADPAKDMSDDRVDLPSSPKGSMEAPNPPNPLKATEDPHAVIITAQAESTLGDFKKSLANQQDARAKAEEKYQTILADMEKLKATNKKSQADQATVLKRAEMGETKLEAVQQELAGLKKHISNMTQAIFGPRAANLQDDCILRLKAIYTLTEQLYTGSVLTVKAVMGAKEPITSIKKMLGCLSTLPP
ncbi:hypothetical protein ZWY2020_006549 [Hordeum vulgare]|nr:hypothetical protein ZWY2020_006549 [Hordeum vulgare]